MYHQIVNAMGFAFVLYALYNIILAIRDLRSVVMLSNSIMEIDGDDQTKSCNEPVTPVTHMSIPKIKTEPLDESSSCKTSKEEVVID
jgi:hypothetical protein